MERADALYAKRSEIENVRQSVELLESPASTSYQAAWRLGRSLFFLGQEAKSQEQARAYFAEGIRASVRAAKLQPELVEGNFWLGVNLALMAQTERQFRAFRYAMRAKKALRRAARIDPGYHAAGPLRVLGRLLDKLPRILGGGHKRARAIFEKALQIAPENTVTKMYFAELLMDAGEQALARLQFEAIINAKQDPAWDFEIKRDRKIAMEKMTNQRSHVEKGL